jgi:hypothetical protein
MCRNRFFYQLDAGDQGETVHKTMEGMASQKIADSFRPIAMAKQIKPRCQEIQRIFS